MAIDLTRSTEELKQMPLVELAWEILKQKKEPYYFRDLMKVIQDLRGMSEEQVMDVIARLYTEINIDGRFVCIGHNVWGLRRWYPVDKGPEKSLSGKRFVRKSGDGFSDDDEDLDDDFDDSAVDELDSVEDAELPDDDDDEDEDLVVEDEDEVFSEDDDESEDDSEEILEDEVEEEDEDLDEDEED